MGRKVKPALFYFGDIVVVEGDLIGCIVKTWCSLRPAYHYEVYVRSLNVIKEYDQSKIIRYVVSKELSEEEKTWH
jgi:hypothetical protein